MSFLPLTLGVGATFGAGGEGPKPLSKSGADKILKRDDFTCRFCGFRSPQYQRVVPVDDGHVTACSFCEQVLNVERAGLSSSGILIWLPEITQAELNHIARAIYVARSEEDSPIAAAANRAFDALMGRRTEAKKRLGTDDPLLLATVLHENISDKEREAAVKKLDGIRLLPLDRHIVRGKDGNDINGFPQIVRFWRLSNGPFAEMPVDEWMDLFTQTEK